MFYSITSESRVF